MPDTYSAIPCMPSQPCDHDMTRLVNLETMWHNPIPTNKAACKMHTAPSTKKRDKTRWRVGCMLPHLCCRRGEPPGGKAKENRVACKVHATLLTKERIRDGVWDARHLVVTLPILPARPPLPILFIPPCIPPESRNSVRIRRNWPEFWNSAGICQNGPEFAGIDLNYNN